MKALLLARVAPALLLSSVLAGGIAVSSYAQTASSGAPSTGTTMTQPTNPGAGASSMSHATTSMSHSRKTAAAGQTTEQMVNQRIADLHARLHITKEQEPQWQQFTQVMRDNASSIDAAYQQRAEQLQSMNAVDNMASYAQIEQTRAQDVQKLVPAFQTLYGSLSDQQKKAADQVFRARAEGAQTHRQASK